MMSGKHDDHAHAPAGASAKDPVCGMAVDPHTARHSAMHAGRPYYFCSARCRERFLAAPERYLAPQEARAEPVPEGTIYTGPMHPEIRQVGPGACPICGMALEPELATSDAGPNPELVDMTRRFWISLLLTAPLVLLAMSEMLPGRPVQHALSARLLTWMQLVFATPVVLWPEFDSC